MKLDMPGGRRRALEDSRWYELRAPGASVLDRTLVLHDGSTDALRLGVHWAAHFGGVLSALAVRPVAVHGGGPADECLVSIRGRAPDLLVVAGDVRGGVRGPAGLSEHLLAELGIPVLACGASTATPMQAMQSVLVPVNGTDGDATVLRLVMPLALAAQAQVTLLHVVESASGRSDPELEMELGELARAEVYVDELASACGGARVGVRTAVRTGPIVSTIAAVARQISADLVALSTRARIGSALAVHGSTGSAIARGVHQTVLLVKS